MQSCISEAQKYQGALYRPQKDKKASKAIVPHKAYVEDVEDESQQHNSHITIVDPPMPSAPSPPSAAPEFDMSGDPVNVFDFLVESATPNASRLELPAPEEMRMIEDIPEENQNQELVRVRFDGAGESLTDLVEYGSGPIPSYQTPGPKYESRKKERKDREGTEKKDKKRKGLHVETYDLSVKGDQIMTDAPPMLHSGLTGGLKGLLSRPSVFPPSPDYSGGDHEASPGSPLKKSKHSKRERGRGLDGISNNIMSLITSNSHSHSSREHSEDRPRRKKHHRRHSTSPEHASKSSRKMIEYKPMEVVLEQAGDRGRDGEMVVFQPRAELLLSFINKGPESERGVSMNKALKRYHRERNAEGVGLSRAEEEKELWRSLRMKRNERGEIVLFLG